MSYDETNSTRTSTSTAGQEKTLVVFEEGKPVAPKPIKRKGITFIRKIRVGRNEPCICGSGKKFKRCCLDKTKKIYVKAV